MCIRDREDMDEALELAASITDTSNTIGNSTVETGVIIEDLGLKICSMSRDNDGKHSKFKKFSAKDLNGKKIFFSLFGTARENFEVQKCYKFNKLKVGNFKGPKEEFFRLTSMYDTKAVEISAVPFSDITIADKKFKGTVIGFSDVTTYPACPSCSCKVAEGSGKCFKCGYNEGSTSTSFFFKVLIQKDEDVVDFKGFKNQLEGVNTGEEDETLLSNLEGRTATVDYYDEDNRNMIAMISFE